MYASSVAAYGFHAENPQPLTEDVPARGSAAHYYSAQKAEVEELLDATLAGADTDGYVFRPCIVAGPQAPLLIDSLPYTQISERLPGAVCACSTACRSSSPCCPTPACRSSSCTTTTSPPRCAPPRSAAARPASTTSPAPDS